MRSRLGSTLREEESRFWRVSGTSWNQRLLKQWVLFATGLGVGLETNPKLLTIILFSKSKLPAVAAAL